MYFIFISYYSFLGLLSWDVTSCHVDLASELDTITNASPPGEESRGGNAQIYSLFFIFDPQGQMTTHEPSVINDFIIFFRRASHSICFGVLSHRGVDIPTAKHSSTMHEKYARKFHKASAYSSWRLHVCRNWCMGFAGQYFKLTITNVLFESVKMYHHSLLFSQFLLGWILYLFQLYKII